MANKLKLFGSMSGMQKSVLAESTYSRYMRKSVDELNTELAELENSDDTSIQTKRNIADIKSALDQKHISNITDQEITKTLNAPKLGKEMSKGQAAYQILQRGKNDELASLELKHDKAVKEAQKKIQDIKTDHTLSLAKRELQVNNAENELSALIISNSEEIEKAKKGAKYAQAKSSGKTVKERIMASTDRLAINNPLIVPIKTIDINKGKLTFNQMFELSHQSEAYNMPQLLDFETAITAINKAVAKARSAINLNPKNPIIKDKAVVQMLSKLEDGNTQNDPDMIKAGWLFLGGNSILASAKQNPLFIAALQKLEGHKSGAITNPIANITDTEDIFANGNVKILFGYIDEYITTKLPEVKEIIQNSVADIIDAPEELYTGFSTTSLENIADTFYYSLINTFGTPDDKTLLLKNKGLAKNSTSFLLPQAEDAVAAKIKSLTAKAEDSKALPASGRVTSWGTRNVNTSYEKGLGSKLAAAVGDMPRFKNSQHPEILEAEINAALAQALDFTAPLTFENKELDSEIAEIKLQLRNATINGEAPEVKQDLQDTYDDLKKDLLTGQSATGTELKQLFLAGKSATLADISNALESRFDSVKATLQIKIDSYAKSKVAGKAEVSKLVFNTVSQKLDDLLNAVATFSPEDVKNLTNLFKASILPGELEGKARKNATKLPITDENDNSGKILFAWATSLLNALPKYEEQAPGVISQDTTETDLQLSVDNIKTSIAQVESEISPIEQAIADEDATPNEEEGLNRLISEREQLTAQYNEAIAKLADAKTKLASSGSVVTNKTFGNSRIANTTRTALTELLANSKKSIDASELYSISTQMPTDLLNYVNPVETEAAKDILDTVLISSEENPALDSWKSGLRVAIKTFLHHLESTSVSADPIKKKALTVLSVPFTSELVAASDFTGKFDMSEVGLQKFSKSTKKALNKAEDKEQKDKEKREEKGKKAVRRKYSKLAFLPGTAISNAISNGKGHFQLADDTELTKYFLNNAQMLPKNAKLFYQEIIRFLKNNKIANKITSEDKTFSLSDVEFSTGLLKLVQRFKETLSTEKEATELESETYLDTYLDNKAGISEVAINPTPEDLLQNNNFANLLDVLNKSVEDNTIWYDKTVSIAPVIGLGSQNLGLKSATLLNLMRCLRNFTSIEAFDLSLNRRNKDILSNILNINNYPKVYTLYSSTALMMKLYFLMKIKSLIKEVGVIEQFSENFINVNINNKNSDPLTTKIQEQLQELNNHFQSNVVAEFRVDFGDGGILDKKIQSDLTLLSNMVKELGGILYTVNELGILTPVSVLEGTLEQVIITQGAANTSRMYSLLDKNDPALNQMYSLLSKGAEGLAKKNLQDCISIIKSGITFYAGYQATKMIYEYQQFDKETGETNASLVDDKINEYFNRPESISFANKFATTTPEEAIVAGKIETTKVSNAAKDGFMNLNNVFLSTFLKDFVWDSLTNSAVKLKIETTAGKYEDDNSEVRKSEESKADILNKREIEGSYPAFLRGVFTQETGYTSNTIVDIASDEGQQKIDKITAANLKKAKDLKETGKLSKSTPIKLTTIGTGDKQTLGVEISITEKGIYKDITQELTTGVKSMGASSGKGAGQGREAFTETTSFGELVMKKFANSLKNVYGLLAATYSDQPETVKELGLYSQTVSASAPKLIQAISAIASKDARYNKEVQTAALEALKSMTATSAPEGLDELTDPDHARSEAAKTFKTEKGKEGIFANIFSFADDAAKDIETNNITTSDILKAINTLLVGDPEEYKSARDLSSSPAMDRHILTTSEIETLSNSIFTQIQSPETIMNILESVKLTLGSLQSSETPDTRKAMLTQKVEDLKEELDTKLNEVNELFKTISDNKTEIPASVVPETGPIGPLPIHRLTPEELALNKLPPTAIEEAVNTEFIDPLSPSEKAKLTREQVRLAKVANAANEPEIIITPQQKLGLAQEAVKAINLKLASAETALQNYSVSVSEFAIVKYLNGLFDKAKTAYNSYLTEIKRITAPEVKAGLIKTKFNPIKDAIPVIIDFILNLKQETGSTAADSISNQFNSFLHKITTEVKQENYTSYVLSHFKGLTEDITTTKPTSETLINKEYIKSMAKFLHGPGLTPNYKRAEDWIIQGEIGTGAQIAGVADSIRQACILRFLTNKAKDNPFKILKYCLDKKVYVCFSVKSEEDNTQKPLYIQYTEFNEIQTIAKRGITQQ